MIVNVRSQSSHDQCVCGPQHRLPACWLPLSLEKEMESGWNSKHYMNYPSREAICSMLSMFWLFPCTVHPCNMELDKRTLPE